MVEITAETGRRVDATQPGDRDTHYAIMRVSSCWTTRKSAEPLDLDTIYPGMLLRGQEEFLRH
jgi:hypothetical protein